MKIPDFIKWLETQDQEAHIEVVVADTDKRGITTTTVEFFDPEKHVTEVDWRGSMYVNPYQDWYNKKVITIGVED
jgi:hypothetical protein